MSVQFTRALSVILLLALLLPFPAPTPTTATPAAASLSDFRMIGQLGGPTYAVHAAYPYLYFGVGPRLVVWNITNPDMPSFVGQSGVLPDVIQDIHVIDSLAFLACDKAGLVVMDISNPVWPQKIGSWNIDGYPDAAFGVYAQSSTVYLTDQMRGLRVIDVSNPGLPAEVGFYDTSGFAEEVVVKGNYAYVADEAYRLAILNLSNPAAPVPVDYDSYYPAGMVWSVALYGENLLVARGGLYVFEDKGLDVVSLANPAAPTLVGSYDSLEPVLDVAASGAYAYMLGDGLEILDLSDPAHPQAAGSFPTGQSSFQCPSSASGYSLHPCRAIAVYGSTVYVADDTYGLKVVSAADPAAPEQVTQYQSLGRVLDVAAGDGYLYAAERGVGMRTINITTPSQPFLAGSFPLTGTLGTVATQDNFAYVGNGWPGVSGLYVIDVTHPSRPVQAAHLEGVGEPNHISVRDDFLYLTTGYEWTGFQIVNIADPTQPFTTGRITAPDMWVGGYDISLRGEHAYVADAGAMRLVNISDPYNPYFMSAYLPDGPLHYIYSVLADPNGGPVYITDFDSMDALDVSDPYSITLDTCCGRGIGWGVDLAMLGSFVLVAGEQYGLYGFDPGDPYALESYLDLPQPGLALELEVQNNVVYVALADGGLGVYALQESTSASIGTNGGSLAAPDGSLVLTFPSGAFSEAVVITHTLTAPGELPGFPGGLFYAGESFSLEAVDSSGAPVQPEGSYSMVVHYDPTILGPVVESTLALYFWDGTAWQLAGGTVDLFNHTLTAAPDHFSYWALLGESRRIHLPCVTR